MGLQGVSGTVDVPGFTLDITWDYEMSALLRLSMTSKQMKSSLMPAMMKCRKPLSSRTQPS